jgi:hypothetical protein
VIGKKIADSHQAFRQQNRGDKKPSKNIYLIANDQHNSKLTESKQL